MAQVPPDLNATQAAPQASVYRITITIRDNFHRQKTAKGREAGWNIGDNEINNGREFICNSAADVRAIIARINTNRAPGDKIKVLFDAGLDVTYSPTADSSVEVYSGRTRVMYDGTALPQRRRRDSQDTEINSSDIERPGPSTQRRLDFQDESPGSNYIALASELAQAIGSVGRSVPAGSAERNTLTQGEESEWEDEESEEVQWDEPIPQRNRVNHRRARPLSQERKSSSHARDHINLAGRKTLTQPGHNLKGSIRRGEPEYMQRIFLAATGPTADEILDMPNTSAKAKEDMLAEQKDSCQKALSLLLRLSLPENRRRSGRDPVMGDIFELRKEALVESNNQIYNRRTAPETLPQNEEVSEEELDSEGESEGQRPRGGLGISLAQVAASSVRKKKLVGSTRRASGPYREPEVSQEESESSDSCSSEEELDQRPVRRNRARPKHNITATEMGMFNGMKLDQKDNMKSCQKIVELGKRLNIHDEDIELMINQLVGLDLKIEDISLHQKNISGVTAKEKYEKGLKEIKSTGVLIFCKNRAHKGKEPIQTVKELLKFEKDLPGLTPLKTWGKETDWNELQTFAVRYDRRCKQEAEKKGNQESHNMTNTRQQGQRRSDRLKNAQGRNYIQEPRYSEKPKGPREHREPARTNGYQRRGRSQSRGRPGRPNPAQKSTFSKNGTKPNSSTYVSREEWDKMTPEQQSRIREKRARDNPAPKSSYSKDQPKTKSVRTNELQRKQK